MRDVLPPTRDIDDPPWKQADYDVLVCEKCEREHEAGELDHNPLTAEAVDSDARGYCERHDEHDEFHTMEI